MCDRTHVTCSTRSKLQPPHLGYTRTPKPFRSTLGTTITLTNADVPPFSLRVCRRDHSTVGERHSHVVDHEMCVRACGGGGDHWCPPSPRSAVVVFWTTPLITQTARSVVLRCTYVSLHHSCHGSTHTTKSALNATPCLLRATRQTRTWTRSRRDLPTQACECRATFGWPAFLAPQPGSGSPSTFAGAPIS